QRSRRVHHAQAGRAGTDRRNADRGGVRAMIVMGIESSCDETGVGIVRLDRGTDGTARVVLLADEVASSVDEHVRYGGVVPEIASRAHLQAMVPTMRRALA